MDLEVFPSNAIFILGTGRFGSRAARILSSTPRSPIWVVDRDNGALSRTAGLPLSGIRMDAVEFLFKNFPSLKPEHTIVPSIPIHLAFEWLRRTLQAGITKEHVPEPVISQLPNTWAGSEGSLLVSYADFVCPEDCPEPADHCTVTGRKRGIPLYERMGGIDSDHHVHIIRSRQLAPGVGGYRVGDLMLLLNDLERNPPGKWLLGTACRCHGIITAFSYRAETQRR